MRTLEDEKREVREYFESQGDEEVVHLEKVHSEKVFGRRHDVWDVPGVSEAEGRLFAQAWRVWIQAAEALDHFCRWPKASLRSQI